MNSFQITYTPDPDTLPGASWAVVEQIPFKPETPSLEDAATLLDAAFDYNPCTGETEPSVDPDTGELDPSMTESEFYELAGELMPSGVCLYEEGYTAYVKVYVSDKEIPFNFTVDQGAEVTEVTEHASSVEYTVELDESTSIPLEYPVYTADDLPQEVTVTDSSGSVIDILVTNDSISFFEPLTGTFTVEHAVYIFLHYVHVPCDPLNDDIPSPRVIVFYDLLAYDDTITAPEIDLTNIPEGAQYIDCRNGVYAGALEVVGSGSTSLCTKNVRHYSKCTCSEDVFGVSYQEETIPCDDWEDTPYEVFDGYQFCVDEEEPISTDNFYLNTCCVEKPEDRVLPLCEESTTIFYGGVPFEDEAWWESNYGTGNVIFIPISPQDGPCGEHIVEWDLGDLDCCGPGLPTLAWYQVHTDLFVGESYIFIVTGGAEPITWSTEAPGITIEASGDTRSARVIVTSCFCEPGSIVATDACDTQISHGIEQGDGYWHEYIVDPRFSYEPNYRDPDALGIPWGTYTSSNDPEVNPTTGYSNSTWAAQAQDEKWKVVQYWSGSTVGGHLTLEVACASSLPDISLMPSYPRIYPAIPNINSYEFLCAATVYSSAIMHLNSMPTAYNIYYPADYGLKVYEWMCPDKPPEVVYDDENSADIVAEGGSAWIRVQDGEPPYTFEVSGQGFYLNSAHTIITLVTSSTAVKVYANDSCGGCEITVTDACKDVVHGTINSDAGEWDTTCNWIGSYIIRINPSSWGSRPYTRNADYCGAGGWGGANSCAALGGGALQVTQHYTWDPRSGGSWDRRNIHLGFICYDSYMDMIEHPDNTIIIDHQDSANRPTQPDSRMQCENYPCTWGC